MTHFNALVSDKTESGQQLEIKKRALASLPEGEVLIRVQWSSLNYKDALSAKGKPGVTRNYPHTPGIDAAGEVQDSSSDRFKPGDKVIVTGYDLGMNTSGGYGEYIRVPAEWVVICPEELDLRTSMIYGTAGLTAALCVEALMENGIEPDDGDILVTGASGGVGAVAVAILAHLGYTVIAASGKEDAADWLKSLGAAEVIGRDVFAEGKERPMLKPRWAGAIDTVGGDILAFILKSTAYGGAVACCGMAASPKLETSVFPFILRGISLLGVDSVELPLTVKAQMWELLAGDWRPEKLHDVLNQEVSLVELLPLFDSILAGQVKGRVLVKL